MKFSEALKEMPADTYLKITTVRCIDVTKQPQYEYIGIVQKKYLGKRCKAMRMEVVDDHVLHTPHGVTYAFLLLEV